MSRIWVLLRSSGQSFCVCPVLIALISFAPSFGQTSTAGVHVEPAKHTESSLGRPQANWIQHSAVISPDSRHVAYVQVKGPAAQCVVLDGREGKSYPEIPDEVLTERGRDPQIRFSPDSNHCAYVARRADGFVVVLDGIEGKLFDDIRPGAPVFSPDSRRMAYIGRRAGKEFVVIADRNPDGRVIGREGKPCDYVAAVPLNFSADSKHLGYPARIGNVSLAIVDGVEIARGQEISEITFSPQGGRYLFKSCSGDPLGPDWSCRLIIDGSAVKHPDPAQPNFSPDGKHVMYQAQDSDGQFIVVDEVEGPRWEGIRRDGVGFSPDGLPYSFFEKDGREYFEIDHRDWGPYAGFKGEPSFSEPGRHVAVTACQNSGCLNVIDGTPGPEFEGVTNVIFSAPGDHALYPATRLGRQFLVIDGSATAYEAVTEAIFSPDGKHLGAIVKSSGEWFALRDGAKGRPFDEPIQGLVFSSSGRLAFKATRGSTQFVVVDSVEQRPYSGIDSIEFSSDGNHIAYIAWRDGNRFAVVDGVEYGPYYSLPTPVVFDGPSTLHFIAVRPGEFVGVRLSF